jgi:hypothetical protein
LLAKSHTKHSDTKQVPGLFMADTVENPSPEAPPKRNFRMNIDRKRRGEVAELAFMHKAAELGFSVTKPYGDSDAYDFILDAGHRLWRVQVRSTAAPAGYRGYRLHTVHNVSANRRMPYSPSQIDFLVAYVVPRQIWYVIPITALGSRRNITLYAQNPKSEGLFEKYREAWCLMACPRDGTLSCNINVERRCATCPRMPE